MEVEDVDAVARIVADADLWKRYGLDFDKARSRFLKGLIERRSYLLI